MSILRAGGDNTSPCNDKSSRMREAGGGVAGGSGHERCVPASSYKDLFYKIGGVGEILRSKYSNISYTSA